MSACDVLSCERPAADGEKWCAYHKKMHDGSQRAAIDALLAEVGRPDPPAESASPQPATTFVPKCPTCGSSDLVRQSLGKRAGKIAAFGIFAIGAASKTFKCKSCGYTW